MYVILVYDCGEKRVGKMLRLCRKYLNWIQNSVFEGEISEVKVKELILKAKDFMDEEQDSLIIFSGRTEKWLDKQVIGKERCSTDNFLQLLVGDGQIILFFGFVNQQTIFDILKINQLYILSMYGYFPIIVHRQPIKNKTTTYKHLYG